MARLVPARALADRWHNLLADWGFKAKTGRARRARPETGSKQIHGRDKSMKDTGKIEFMRG